MIHTANGNKKNGAKMLAILLIFVLVFQVETPILFSAVSRITPIRRTSSITPLANTVTPLATTDTVSVTPVTSTTEFFSTSPITETTAPVQTVQLAEPVNETAAVGTVTTVTSPVEGPVVVSVQQIGVSPVERIQPTADIAIGEVSTTINEDGTITVLPTVQSFSSPATDTNLDPLVFDNTTGTSYVVDIRPEEEGTFQDPDENAFVPEDDDFFTADLDTSDNNTNNDSNDDAIPNPPVTPTTTSNTNPFVPTPQSNTGGGGGGGSSSGGVTLGDGRSPQPTVLNTKLSDFVGGGMIGLSGRLLKFLKNQKNKDKKNKKKSLKKTKLVQGEEEETDGTEIQSEEESTMTLVVDGQEIEVQKGQNAELKAKEALRPILKAIQKDSLGNDLKIDVVQDIASVFSFQSNAVNVASKPQSRQESIKVIKNSEQAFIPSRQLKTVRLTKRISPLQFHKIHKLHTIATQEGTFINEFSTGADPDHAFPGE